MSDQFTPQDPSQPSGQPGPEQVPHPGLESQLETPSDHGESSYRGSGRLEGRRALITGGDSGIGRAVALAFAREGADVAIVHLPDEQSDADETVKLVQDAGRTALSLPGDIRDEAFCSSAVQRTVDELGGLDVLVNNAAYQMAQKRFEDVTEEQFRRTFETNMFGYFYMAQAALPHLTAGDAIINTGSIVGLVGNPLLVDYCASKGAIHAFTKALALNLGARNIRVNAVAPGPVWTPNIPATMPIEEVENFGHEVALGRPGQPEELAPAYVFLASSDGSFVTGSIVEITGGKLASS